MSLKPIHVIGGGLAGSEAAWQVANLGVPVILHEMRPEKMTPAHKTGQCAELVCSNSFRSDDVHYNAVGLLHEELRRCGSLIMTQAARFAVPAGGALAVDRDLFSKAVTESLENHPLISICHEHVQSLDPSWDSTIIATGPLTSPELAADIQRQTGEEHFFFFDAIAPIVYKESLNFEKVWMQSRYDKSGPSGTGSDYINCPLEEEDYKQFVEELLKSEKIDFKEWEKTTPYFEGCMPIEVMAARGIDTLRFGPMKPVGLTNPKTGKRPYAVIQLRQDNALGTLYNMVGFQTKMKHAEQGRVFRMIPGLENAEFARLGGLHRNTFINAPALLTPSLALKNRAGIRFAGQITGCEGYVESTAVGLMAGLMAAYDRKGFSLPPPPQTTAMGSILLHITSGADTKTFQPMNVNFGLFPPLEKQPSTKGKEAGRARKKALAERALADMDQWIASRPSF